jgi:hypothetical protein
VTSDNPSKDNYLPPIIDQAQAPVVFGGWIEVVVAQSVYFSGGSCMFIQLAQTLEIADPKASRGVTTMVVVRL